MFINFVWGMFTGIIETLGKILVIERQQGNVNFTIESSFLNSLKIDQSLAHNGVCLTVVEVNSGRHTVVAIQETLLKTNLNVLKVGDWVNLERCMIANGRFDGHVVQGHVDQIGYCEAIEDQCGSWKLTFSYDESLGNVTVEKGSICVNGVSLTVVDSHRNSFSVCIIPYTYEHTNFQHIRIGDSVNLEFDIIGKYVARMMKF